MAVVSRIATIQIQSVTGGTRTFTATAVTQDSAAGSSVSVTLAQTSGGLGPPDTPNQDIQLRFYRVDGFGAGDIIREVTMPGGTASQAFTFFFTADGLSGGGDRAGTIRLRLRVEKTNGGPLATYTAHSDGNNEDSLPVGWTVSQRDQGWIRATTTSTIALSNVALGGAKVEPAVYDESIFSRQTIGATLYTPRSFTHALTSGGGSGATASQASGNFDVTRSAICDNRFPAAETTVSVSVTIPNTTLTGLPETTFSTPPADSITIDPRLTAAHLFQLDDNSYGTPPLSKLEASAERPATSIAYLGTNFRHARGEQIADAISGGVNGVTADFTLTADLNGDQVSRSATSTTEGGEAGWTAGFMAWTSPLPGGEWDKAVTITAPADITGASYLLGSTASYQLLASRSPFIRVLAGAGMPGEQGDHFMPGSTLLVGAALLSTKIDEIVAPDSDPAPIVLLLRFNVTTGEPEFYDSDLTWKTLASGTPAYEWALSPSPGDARVFLRTFTGTEGWGETDLFIVPVLYLLAVAYDGFDQVVTTGDRNRHSTFDFDPTGLFK